MKAHKHVEKSSIGRDSIAGILIENWLDNYEHMLSPDVWDELEKLAGKVDEVSYRQEIKIEELKSDKVELEKEVQELEGKLE
jgi:hypothetical protein